MKIIEESQLKKTISQLNIYQEEHKSIKYFYKDLDELKLDSLQHFSFQQDDAFFNEVSFILSVISSIIAHPHLSNKGEDIVVRASTAGHLSTESFQQVFKDTQLWKEKDYEMIPEYVHHYQYTDELKIYENIFIGMLIHLIDVELSKYSEFYMNLLPSFDQDDIEISENKNIEKTLAQIDDLERKLRYIKNTYFYKEISKCNLALRTIQPTNILLKDRLYHYCFKFYRKFIQYEDKDCLLEDFRKYYFFTILKVFKDNHFVLDENKSQKYNHLSFLFRDYQVEIALGKTLTNIDLTISHHHIVAKHNLILQTERDFQMPEFEIENALTTNVMTLWNTYQLAQPDQPIFSNRVSEYEMITDWLMHSMKEVQAKRDIYSKYCPVCKHKNLNQEDEIYMCPDCKTMYTFKKDEKKDTIWFIQLRR